MISLPFHLFHQLLHLNLRVQKKLQKSVWLISAMVVVFNQLRGPAEVSPQGWAQAKSSPKSIAGRQGMFPAKLMLPNLNSGAKKRDTASGA